MNYNIKTVIFKIKDDKDNKSYSVLKMYYNKIFTVFKIVKHLGEGTYGKVYLIEDINKDQYVIKISIIDNDKTLLDEVNNMYNLFKNNNIVHSYYPLCYGDFRTNIGIGILYPYFGTYNLETINILNLSDCIDIIKEIINQLNNLNKIIIHGDLKSSNIVVNDKTKKPTIIDFGLSKSISDKTDIISTYYISSPESLLTLEDFRSCVLNITELDISKHDYFGLFTIICSLFTNDHFWNIIYKYLINSVGIKCNYLNNSKAIIIFVYMWYKFNYKNSDQITNKSLYNLIIKIEDIYPNIKNKLFISFQEFYDTYIVDDLRINIDKIQLYDMLNKLIKFEPENRPSLDDLLNHSFLN